MEKKRKFLQTPQQLVQLLLGAIAHRLSDGLTVLEYHQHGDAGHLKSHGKLHLLVHVDLAYLADSVVFLCKLMQQRSKHLAGGVTPVGVEVEQDGPVGAMHLIIIFSSAIV